MIRLENVRAVWGGGTLTAAGTAGLAADAPFDLQLQAREVSLRYPRDFRSRLRADLTLRGRPDSLLLAGEVHAERGLYDTDINLAATFLAPSVPPPPASSSSFLQNVGLDLTVVTDRPMIVRNNLAELEASGRLRVRGDARYPAPFGRLEVRDGGKVFLQTREFTIRNGSLTYNGSLDPEISITAETVISQLEDEDVRVTAVASGPLERPTLDLRSDPSYTEREIASLVATGRRGVLDSPGGAAWAAGEQTAVLLAGRITRGLSRNLRDLGLDEVDIQPQLLARETDPGARFTFGKLITPQLKLIYSMGLNDTQERFFEAQYRVRIGREVSATVQREDDGDIAYGAGQRWRWGGDRTRARGGRRRGIDDAVKLTEVRLSGVPPELDANARARLRVEPGSSTTFWRLQDESERVQELLHSAGYLEALASADLDGTVGVIEARPGPRYAWMVEGLPSAPDLNADVQRAFFEEEAIENGRARLLDEAHRRGYVKARVTAEVRGDQAARTIVFQVALGQPAVVREVTFTGAAALSSRSLLEAAGGQAALLGEPLAARDRIAALYRAHHYLAAQVALPRVQESEDRGAITIDVAIDEGPQALLAEVRFEGTTRDETELADAARIETGLPFDPVPVEDAVQRIRAYYLERGFASVRVAAAAGAARDRPGPGASHRRGAAAVRGRRRVRGPAAHEGGDRQARASLQEGRPAGPAQPSRCWSGACWTSTSSAGPPPPHLPTSTRPSPCRSGSRGPTRFSTTRATARTRASRPWWTPRSATSPAPPWRWARASAPARTSARCAARCICPRSASRPRSPERSSARRRTSSCSTSRAWWWRSATFADTERQQGFEIQQSQSAPLKWDLLFGYRFKRIESLMRDFRQDISSVQASVLRESRDSTLDAREGLFLSLSLELAPEFMGSDFQFFRTLAQAFYARPLGRLADLGPGPPDRPRERARRAGPHPDRAVRPFDRDVPRGRHPARCAALRPTRWARPVPSRASHRGGEALLILNQEIRYRHPIGIGLAAFYDGGNVYPEIKDLWTFKFRHSIGAGIRYDSPVGLLRLDFGFPLNKRTTDRSFQWFFSVGQAF